MSPDSTSVVLAEALNDLASPRHAGHAWVRVTTTSGIVHEGTILAVDAMAMSIVDPTRLAPVDLHAAEIRTLELRSVGQAFAWVSIGFAIVSCAALFGGFVHLSRTSTFLLLATLCLLPALSTRTRLARWPTKWRMLYPPRSH
jgi:hypothetical protein